MDGTPRADGAGEDASPPHLDAKAIAAAPWLREAHSLLHAEGGIDPLSERGVLRLLDRIDPRMPLAGFPWCGLFVAHCLRTAIPDLTPPRLYFRARPWLRWGHEVQPQLGALLITWRMHPRTPFGHVGFYWAEDETTFHTIGGNQKDRIMIQRRPKARLLAARWPDGIAHSDRRRLRDPAAEIGMSAPQARSE